MPSEKDYEAMLTELLDADHGLTEREIEFLDLTIEYVRVHHSLCTTQMLEIERIYERVF